jgi:hypothetical protein
VGELAGVEDRPDGDDDPLGDLESRDPDRSVGAVEDESNKKAKRKLG